MKEKSLIYCFAVSVSLLGICIVECLASNKCDRSIFLSSHTECRSCAVNSQVDCNEGFLKISNGSGIRDCRYTLEIRDYAISLPGCRHTCIMRKTQALCCPGYWGPDCMECPGGASAPCNNRGICSDGMQGNGTCSCKAGFGGTACETCAEDTLYGTDCSSECDCLHGVCNSGITGDGICLCLSGYGGLRCDQPLPECKALKCSENYRCVSDGSGVLVCKCLPNYQEIGAKCQPINPCLKKVCDAAADCTYIGPNKHKCTCKEGYKGDGKVCLPVDPCQTNFGNCPTASSVCKYDGPGKSHCECKSGYKNFQDGKGCELVDVCATKNPCSKNANCTTVAPGKTECTCKKGYIGDGISCFGNILDRMKQLNENIGQWRGKLSTAISLFEVYSWPLSSMGPFTVLVPINKGMKGKDVKNILANKENALYFIKLHMIAGQMTTDVLNNTNLIYTLTGKSGEITTGNEEFRIRIHGSKKTGKVIEENIIASNGILHIIDKAMDFVEPTLESNKKESIMEILQENGRYNLFHTLLEKSNLGSSLEKDGSYTVFVPNNAALQAMGNGTLDYLLSKEGSRKLLELVRYHIVSPAELDVANIISANNIMSMANQLIQFNTTNKGQILVNGEEVEEADVAAKNGRIYTLDGVLIPPSILPILPHRCDDVRYELQHGSCISCTMMVYSRCPEGSKRLDIFSRRCFQRTSIMGSDYPVLGCSRYCNVTVKVPKCCKGFYSPDCNLCPGGYSNPCSGNGECMDGMKGNGTCVCDAGYTGTECQRCSDDRKYGIRCDKQCLCIHGRCNNHIHSDGSCLPGSCLPGYVGKFCDQHTTPCGPQFTFCHAHADCVFNDGIPSCVCKVGYEGDGTYCKEVNPCFATGVQVCNINAECFHLGQGKHKCVCRPGWTGDGQDCSAINNCLQSNGGCHANATCEYIGPGQSDCECNTGFRGNGIECEQVNACLEDTKCHPLATCQKMPLGFWECVCRDPYEGDGTVCFGNVANVISSLGEASEFWKWFEDPSILSLITQTPNITVLVPSQQAFSNMNQHDKTYWMNKGSVAALLKYHILNRIYKVDDLKNLSSSDMLATSLSNNFLKLSKENGNVTVGGANLLVGDVAATNGVVHLIDKVLTPDILLVTSMPDLMARLDQMPDYSIFRGYIIQYKLAERIEAYDSYTIFAPSNDAINSYIQKKQPATLDEDAILYHVILGEQLMKNDLKNGMHRETMLGFSFQIGFFIHDGQVYVNGAPVNYTNAATNKGVIHGLGKVLEIQKNRCDTNETTTLLGKCAECGSEPICPPNTQPEPTTKKACIYTKYILTKRYIHVGCQMKCSSTVITRECCSGFFGAECLPCPAIAGNACFGNGICMDGINGTGKCQCEDGYNGTACENCIKGKYGSRCDQECSCVNGICNDGLGGDGTCQCDVGWRGVNCDIQIKDDKCSKSCHTSANCLVKTDGTPYCQCAAGFKGNGTFCSAVDACETSNGGCSVNAECRKTKPGSRICVCNQGYTGDGIVCLEINPCITNNGGCAKFAECTKTGPNQATCNCLPKYSGDGKKCSPINPCITKNGGCSEFAKCSATGPGERNCTCKTNYMGDGVTCRGNIYEELKKYPQMSEFYSMLQSSSLNELSGSGPFTVFAPTSDAFKREPRTKEWIDNGIMDQVLLYHIVHCAQVPREDLTSLSKVTSLQGESLKIASTKDSLTLNGEANVASNEQLLTNGILYTIDKVLVPQNMQTFKKDTFGRKMDNLTAVADAYGYTTMVQLLQNADLMALINDPIHKPVTIFLPSDNTLKNLPKDQHDFLFNNDNKDKLSQYLKYHIFRDGQVNSVNLPDTRKTLQGSELTVKCGDKDSVGDLFLDNRQCKIIQRQLLFDGGVAYGIDCLLTPSSVGGRCDNLVTFQLTGNCGFCFNTPNCPSGSKPQGAKTKCPYTLTSKRVIDGCRYDCAMVLWMTKCCSGYYGRDCQACPGGPEKPCNNHGTCTDGYAGTGECRCLDGFNGTACDTCLPGRYGSDCKFCDCTSHGQCDEGYSGTGTCACQNGWTGKRCETKINVPPVCTPPCSSNAVCKKNMCECNALYEGDGITCTVVDLCKQKNGGCDTNAKCSQNGVKVTCGCLKGYTGDGKTCAPIDRCADGLNGGCDEHATCTMTGPDKRQCECKDQYIGNGESCELKQLPIDRCLQDNGQCHINANCDDLHFQDTLVGVFHLRSTKGTYKFTFDEAAQGCTYEGGTLATYNQLLYAQQAGYSMCSAGWMEKAQVGYPMAFSNPNCGSGHVGIIDYKIRVNLSETWDAFCYRVKDVECTCKYGYIGDGYNCNGNILQVLMSFPIFSNFVLGIMAYSNTSQNGKDFVNYLTNLSIQATLFAPSNDGLFENHTLSGRDIEYHLANVSTFFFDDLSNGTALQTRIGNKLTISMDNDLDRKKAQTAKNRTKYVDGKVIRQWDFYASNGIIHMISEPLKAPPEPIALHAGHGAGIFFSIVLVIGLVALAIYAYKKFNRRDFQFQQFNDYDDKQIAAELDGAPVANLSNPMYESSTKPISSSEPTIEPPFDPFSDDEQQLVTIAGLKK
ncbi:stabilin-2 [Pelobates fuscus]|uniref:stabilin-2 n=1 Tax=Pelobates fuscus TaxID=191477 RepID=UPI002FE455EF